MGQQHQFLGIALVSMLLMQFLACHEPDDSSATPASPFVPTADIGYAFDHVVIFASTSALEDSLLQLFTPAEKLATHHTEQGTYGRYFLFYNTFIELLYLEDSAQAVANQERFGHAYTRRWSSELNLAPLGFGINASPWDSTALSQTFVPYRSAHAPASEYYFMAKGNKVFSQPMIYLSQPHRAYQPFDSLAQVDERVEEFKRDDLKAYLTHPTGIERLTKVLITTPEPPQPISNAMLLDELGNVSVKHGKVVQLILEFDNHRLGNELVVDANLRVVIRY